MSTERPRPATVEPSPDSPIKKVDWNDFRDHLATADREGNRKWIFARKPKGRFHNLRLYVSWVLLAVMFTGPFIRIGGEPLLLMNIIERKFVILGQVFWPQDILIFATGLLIFLVGIAVFTAAYGRLWCGWTCPQTVLMEMVFRKIEYALEGDAPAQRELAKAPWTAGKVARKVLKHAIFFGLSFIIGNTLLSYIIGTEQLKLIVTDNPANHLQGLTFMVLFTFIFYAIFARFREQACTFICPYGRFQSTLLDENSIVVAYDHRRGEKRGLLHRAESPAQRQQAGFGDCIDCHQCVAVCPTGIDIRNGTQLECVHCTACIDACDTVMDKIKRPRGLIRYASLNGIEKGEKLRLTPRLVGYSVLLGALGVLLAVLLLTRSDVQATVLRAQGALFQQMPDGHFSNLYNVKVVNKTAHDMPVELRLENITGEVRVMGAPLLVPARKLAESPILVELSASVMKSGTTPIVVGIYANGRRLQTIKTAFIGPRNDT